jgi:glycogen operon protein
MRRLYGSDDLFPDNYVDAYRPFQSVNFVTAHDGLCLYDLVAYTRDRHLSWDCGWEGDDAAPADVLELRRRQVKNFACLLLLANGTPMLTAGSELMQTQHGNDNPYDQDNETTWLDWDLLSANRDVFRFFKTMIAFRKAHPSIARSTYWREDVTWYGLDGPVDLGAESRTLAYCLRGASQHDGDLYVMINGHWQAQSFVVQDGAASGWLRVADTSLASPNDIAEPGAEVALSQREYVVGPRSGGVLRRPSA